MEMHMQRCTHCTLQMILLLCSVTDRGIGEIVRYEDVCATFHHCTSQMTLSQLVEWGKWFNVELCVRRCTVAHYQMILYHGW